MGFIQGTQVLDCFSGKQGGPLQKGHGMNMFFFLGGGGGRFFRSFKVGLS